MTTHHNQSWYILIYLDMLIYANLALCIWFCPTDPDVCLRIPLSCFWNTSPGFWGPGPWCVNQTLLQVATPQVEKLQGRGEIQSQTNQSFQWSGTCVCLLAHGRTFVTVVYPINIYKYHEISIHFTEISWKMMIPWNHGGTGSRSHICCHGFSARSARSARHGLS